MPGIRATLICQLNPMGRQQRSDQMADHRGEAVELIPGSVAPAGGRGKVASTQIRTVMEKIVVPARLMKILRAQSSVRGPHCPAAGIL